MKKWACPASWQLRQYHLHNLHYKSSYILDACWLVSELKSGRRILRLLHPSPFRRTHEHPNTDIWSVVLESSSHV
jgi:hypothetical protein